MKSISTLAIAVSLVVGGAAVGAPALAQKNKKGQAAPAAAPGERQYKLSKEERAAIAPLQQAIQAKDFAQAATLLPAAQAAAKGGDARFILANLQLQVALETKDLAGQAAAIEAMLASGGVAAADQPKLYRALGQLYTQLKQKDRAAAAYQKLAQLEPNNVEVLLVQAEAAAASNPTEAVNMLQKAMAAQKAAGQAIPENWYKRALKFAYEGKLAPQTAQISRELVTAYPTPENWRDALTIYRQSAQLDKSTETDVLRLMRAARAMKGDSDYLTLASNLNDMGLPGESKAVIDEGVAARAINGGKDYFRALLAATGGRVTADRAGLAGLETRAQAGANGKLALSTADALYGYGEYARAAALYRAAIQKGGIDNNIANLRLGAALAQAGQKAEAQTALKAVTGPRQNLAAYWLILLGQRA
jgi:tetratricopeptide (TPR) repeat protein